MEGLTEAGVDFKQCRGGLRNTPTKGFKTVYMPASASDWRLIEKREHRTWVCAALALGWYLRVPLF